MTTLSKWPQIIKKVIKITPFEPYAQLPISGCTYLYDQKYLLVVNRAGLRGAIWARVFKNVCQHCSRPNNIGLKWHRIISFPETPTCFGLALVVTKGRKLSRNALSLSEFSQVLLQRSTSYAPSEATNIDEPGNPYMQPTYVASSPIHV
jgi:hypothetical protein